MENERKRILCVDDDTDTLGLYAVMFYDYEVLSSSSVAETLLRARKSPVDLYVLDAWLPDGTGVKLCREIRKFDPNTPILFVSGAVEQGDQDEAIRAGAQAYLIKPVGMFDLQAAADALIRQAICRSLEARSIELNAIREAIAEHMASLDQRMALLNTPTDDAAQQMLRSAGYSAFTRAGGSRVAFERFWPAALEEVNPLWATEEQ